MMPNTSLNQQPPLAIAHDKASAACQKLEKLRESLEVFDGLSYQNATLTGCKSRIIQLENKKREAKKIYAEYKTPLVRLSSYLEWICLGHQEKQANVRRAHQALVHDIDQRIDRHQLKIDLICRDVLHGTRGGDDPIEAMAGFVRGASTIGSLVLHRDRLRELYRQIETFAIEGHYTLDMVQALAKTATGIIPEHELFTEIMAGKDVFVFHSLCLAHQLAAFRQKQSASIVRMEVNFPPEIVETLYQLIEEGRRPAFYGFGEGKALLFLEALKELGASPALVDEGLFLFHNRAANFDIKIYDSRSEVVCRDRSTPKTLRKLSAINSLRPVRKLRCYHPQFFPGSEELRLLASTFGHLRVLEVGPCSTASSEDWKALFDLPKLNKIILTVSEFREGDEEYCQNLIRALKSHSKPPVIQFDGPAGFPYELREQLTVKNPT